MTRRSVTPLADIDLRPLAELEASERAFLSCYISGAAGRRSLRNRIDRVRRLLAGNTHELDHFEASLALLLRWLDEETQEDDVVAVFACGALDFIRGWRLAAPVPDILRAGAAPYLRPLAELQDEYGTLAVVAATNRATSIHLVTLSRTLPAGRVRGDVKNAVKKGGWSQKRYARRREKQLERYATEVVERLDALDREHEIDRIVLLGSAESLREIEGAIPQRLRDRVFRRDQVEVGGDIEDVIDEAWIAWFDAEREGERDLRDEIREEAFGDGLAAIGAGDVLAALREGRVDTLLLRRDSEVEGTRCRSCEHVAAGRSSECSKCGGADVFPIDLVNEIVRQAELTGAYVEFADPSAAFDNEDGVAALLRY